MAGISRQVTMSMLGRKHVPGIAGLVMGVVSLLALASSPFMGVLLAISGVICGLVGLVLARNDVAGSIGIVCAAGTILEFLFVNAVSPLNPIEYNVMLCVVGYGFAVANVGIGITHIKDLDQLKQQLGLARLHKIYGRVETVLFFGISAICIAGPVRILLGMPESVPIPQPVFLTYPTVFWHTFVGGILAFVLFLVKVIPAFGNKDAIFKHGWILGPIGFIAWSLGYFTSLVDYFDLVIPDLMMVFPSPPLIWPSMGWAIATSVALGIILFLNAKNLNARATGAGISPRTHGVALILHGISFGYENAAKELVGAPVLYKYVYPYTYKSLDKLAIFLGLNIEQLKAMNVNDALETYMDRCAKIGMAEKIRIKWTSDSSFDLESINCSTAAVRSKIPKEEIKGSICPWALLAASLVNKLTGKDLEIAPSEFNEVGAKTELRIKEPVR